MYGFHIRFRTPGGVLIWGLTITTTIIAIVTAVGGLRWLVSVLVITGAVAIATKLFWHWEAGLFGTELRNAVIRVAEIPVLSLYALLVGFTFQILFVVGTILLATQPPNPNDGPLFQYLNTVLGGGVLCFLQTVLLIAIVWLLYGFHGLMRSRRG